MAPVSCDSGAKLTSLRIIDSQVHIWDAPSEREPWVAGATAFAHRPGRPLGPEELLTEMTSAGVEKAILVPPSWVGDNNDFVLRATLEHPERFGWMGRVSLTTPQSALDLRRWKEATGALGLRLTFVRESEGWLQDGTAAWIWNAADEADLPLMIYAPGQQTILATVARDHPDLQLIVDHLGLNARLKDINLLPLIKDTLELARFPNVAVKASGLPSMVGEPYPFASLFGVVRETVRGFGPQRVFWGTDFSRLSCTLSEAVNMFTREMTFLSDEDLTWIMGRGVAQWLHWEQSVDTKIDATAVQI